MRRAIILTLMGCGCVTTSMGERSELPAARRATPSLRWFLEQGAQLRAATTPGAPMPRARGAAWLELYERLAEVMATADAGGPEALIAELRLDAQTYGDIDAPAASAALAVVEALSPRPAVPKSSTGFAEARWAWPLDPVRVSSPFGGRFHPLSGDYGPHRGVDLEGQAGQSVFASKAGQVEQAGWSGAHGISVLLRHDSRWTTRYSHLSRVEVRVGESVERGDTVGRVGSTGQSTGPHLHFEVWHEGDAVDPEVLLPVPGRSDPWAAGAFP